MRIQTIVVGLLKTNCYVVFDDETKEASVIDPGGDYTKIVSFLSANELMARNIFLTHGHFDHLLAAALLKEKTGARLVVHEADAEMLKKSDSNMYLSIAKEPFRACTPDVTVTGGARTKLGEVEAQFIHTPGHTPGSVCIAIDNALFTGDTLFKNDCGRTDLEGGSEDDMRDSLRALFELDYDYIIYPGHGPVTTLFAEKQNNPYLRAAGLGVR